MILALINFSVKSEINCQVGAVFCIWFLRALTGQQFQGLGHNRLGEHPPPRDLYERVVCPDILFLDCFCPGWLWLEFDIDHASHVSFYACIHAATSFPKYVLMELSSFAIWDRNKIVLGISAVIWLINFGFQLAGKLPSSIPL